MQLVEIRADIKMITDKFLAPGRTTGSFSAFVRGEIQHPVTERSVRGLPQVWCHTFGDPSDTSSVFVFLDLPDPSTPDPETRISQLAPFLTW